MMTTATEPTADRPVRKSITVKASTDRAFRVFSEGIDTWWPRTHHIGKSPMKKVIIEGRAGGGVSQNRSTARIAIGARYWFGNHRIGSLWRGRSRLRGAMNRM